MAGPRGLLGWVLSAAFWAFAAGFALLRLGEYLLLLRLPEVPAAAAALLAMNFLAPALKLPFPGLKFQLGVFMLAVIYYFDWHTAARSFPDVDLAGKVAVVTGANSGLGFATAMALAERNATVVLACRDDAKCSAAADAIGRDARGTGELVPMRLDLADLTEVRRFSTALAKRFPRVDILVNNAGYYAFPLGKPEPPTPQGLERCFGTMHMGHYALTEWVLRSNDRGSEDMAVVMVASGMHHLCQLYTAEKGAFGGGSEDACLPDAFFESRFADGGLDSYSAFPHLPNPLRTVTDIRYHRAKLANVLHTMRLAERYPSLYVSASSLGFVASNISPMHRFLGQRLGSLEQTLGELLFRNARPHGIRPVLLGAVLRFAPQWAQTKGINPAKSGALIDTLGDVVDPFSFEAAVGLKSAGGQGKLAQRLDDVSAAILADFEAAEAANDS